MTAVKAATRIATVDGEGTGRIAAATGFVTVVSDDSDRIVTLPRPRPGRLVWLRNPGPGFGYALRANDPATVAVNGGSGAAAEVAVAADSLLACLSDAEASWVCSRIAADGSVVAVSAAAPRSPNLVRNGSFVGHVGGWVGANDGVSVAFASGASRGLGSGSLAATVPANDGGSLPVKAAYRPGGRLVLALGALTAVDAVAYGLSDDPAATIALTVAFYGDADGCSFVSSVDSDPTAPLDDAAWTICQARNVPVPDGATHASLAVGFPTATGDQPVAIDDVYLGAVGGDAPPYPAANAVAFPANGLVGGDFEGGVACPWGANWGSETLEADAVSPIAGTTSLKVTTLGNNQEEGVFYAAPGMTVVEPELTVPFRFKAKGDGVVLDVWVGWRHPNSAQVVDTITLGAEPATYEYEIAAPVGKHLAVFGFWTSDDVSAQAAVFWLDDVSLGTPP